MACVRSLRVRPLVHTNAKEILRHSNPSRDLACYIAITLEDAQISDDGVVVGDSAWLYRPSDWPVHIVGFGESVKLGRPSPYLRRNIGCLLDSE